MPCPPLLFRIDPRSYTLRAISALATFEKMRAEQVRPGSTVVGNKRTNTRTGTNTRRWRRRLCRRQCDGWLQHPDADADGRRVSVAEQERRPDPPTRATSAPGLGAPQPHLRRDLHGVRVLSTSSRACRSG
jgi:hypothetical protein